MATILAVLFLLVSIPGIAGTNKGISETEGHRKTGKNPPRKRHAPTDQSDQSVYRVKKGDTLYRIGKQFGVEPAEIRSYNNLSDNDAILPGASLKIPRKSASGVTPPRNSSYRDESVSGTVKNSAYIWPVNGIISVKRDGEE
ncbi:MAG TPA: LysM peptidoglycan-binding domain-containing protein, partial [Spirochaetota bacterium]